MANDSMTPSQVHDFMTHALQHLQDHNTSHHWWSCDDENDLEAWHIILRELEILDAIRVAA